MCEFHMLSVAKSLIGNVWSSKEAGVCCRRCTGSSVPGVTTISFQMECRRHLLPSVGQVGSDLCHVSDAFSPKQGCRVLSIFWNAV